MTVGFKQAMAVLGVSLALCGAVMAAPSAAMPSMVKVGDSAALVGQGFAAGTVLTVRVTAPGGAVSLAAVTVGPQGQVRHTVVPASGGKYRVEVLDGSNAALVALDFGAMPR
jgi:hypothetical protein